MDKLLSQKEINNFLEKIDKIYPNFIAGVIADHNGFPIASRIPKDFPLCENELALYTVINREREILENTDFIKVKRDLSKDKKVKLLLLLDKKNHYIYGFKELKAAIRRQILF
ncbi:MAG: hypothetical protein P8Y70_12185 [Candidatus Lokiarchaeota archaeon]